MSAVMPTPGPPAAAQRRPALRAVPDRGPRTSRTARGGADRSHSPVARDVPAPGPPRLLLAPLAESRELAAERALAALVPPPHLSPPDEPVLRAWGHGQLRLEPAPTELPDPDDLCSAVVLAAVEALNGTRPLAQLTRWVSPQVYEALAEQIRSTGTRQGRTLRRATVRPAHLCRVSPRVAEAGVVVHDGSRARAAAIRVEAHRGSWRATVLQIG
ncbi:Rv3235 family protein [Actinotalea sp. K2]|uniref:Rv3235 family protein n=1 Tax=Actinotalea sp. K2 TaxID=2939438 RepID=UPI00201804C5|nr:Rv3235 family protein [Actinotalea sp. K2]MCL3862663.1 Rv3235 family protein [Actinotalea sp. K2]